MEKNMNLVMKILGGIILISIGGASMYLIFNSNNEAFGCIGMSAIFCLHLAYKYKFNWRKS
jgi:hypothetical protein